MTRRRDQPRLAVRVWTWTTEGMAVMGAVEEANGNVKTPGCQRRSREKRKTGGFTQGSRAALRCIRRQPLGYHLIVLAGLQCALRGTRRFSGVRWSVVRKDYLGCGVLVFRTRCGGGGRVR